MGTGGPCALWASPDSDPAKNGSSYVTPRGMLTMSARHTPTAPPQTHHIHHTHLIIECWVHHCSLRLQCLQFWRFTTSPIKSVERHRPFPVLQHALQLLVRWPLDWIGWLGRRRADGQEGMAWDTFGGHLQPHFCRIHKDATVEIGSGCR
jgi:hypothetical protein